MESTLQSSICAAASIGLPPDEVYREDTSPWMESMKKQGYPNAAVSIGLPPDGAYRVDGPPWTVPTKKLATPDGIDTAAFFMLPFPSATSR
jgi:hypothetical protein